MRTLRQLIGQRYERLACRYLRRQGFSLVATNYRCRFGELDLVMTRADWLVFVEVRYRKAGSFGAAVDTIGRHKQRRLLLTASQFLQRYPQYAHHACRFDVIAVDEDATGIVWIQGAFT